MATAVPDGDTSVMPMYPPVTASVVAPRLTTADSTVPTAEVVTSLVKVLSTSSATGPPDPAVPATVTVDGAAPTYVPSSSVQPSRVPVSPPVMSVTSSV